MLVSPLRRESLLECADENQPIRFSFSAFSLSEKRFRKRCFFDSIIKAKRVPTVFLQKSLIFFSSKREKSVEYRVRGTFPEKSFRRQVVKSEKSVEYRVRKFFQKTFRSNHKKAWNTG